MKKQITLTLSITQIKAIASQVVGGDQPDMLEVIEMCRDIVHAEEKQ